MRRAAENTQDQLAAIGSLVKTAGELKRLRQRLSGLEERLYDDLAQAKTADLSAAEIAEYLGLSRQRVQQLLAKGPDNSSHDASLGGQLTAREAQILELLGKRLSNREIGEQLSISPKTVEIHVRHILNKLALDSRAAARQPPFRRKVASNRK